MNKPALSIITVCYNAEKTIRNTIESIVNQTFTDFEYIIVDGASSDRTYQIVCEYEEKFRKRGITFKHISEKDTGIYNAMNKGTDMATGSWINFMNADDKYTSNGILEQVFAKEKYEEYGIVYGDVNLVSETEVKLDIARPIENITRAMVFSHQSTFVRTDIQKKYRFREEYRISADYDMLLRAYLDKVSFQHIDCTVADFSIEGFCNSNKYKTYLETLRIQEDNGVINQKSMGICCRKVFNYFRIKFEDNKLMAPVFKGLIKLFGRG